MATKSFLKNVEIRDTKLVQQFVNTLNEAQEKAQICSDTQKKLSRECIELKENDIKEFFGVK